MKKYIGFNFKYNSDLYRRAGEIREVGFDGVFLYAYHDPNQSIKAVQAVGLKVETLHLPYKASVGVVKNPFLVNCLWEGGQQNKIFKAMLLQNVAFARKNGIKTLVMHVTAGDNPPPFSEEGVDFIDVLVNECGRYGIVLCLENIRRLDYIAQLFECIRSPYLKFCFDTGHANCMTKNLNFFPWETFGQYLYCLHISDNNGVSDEHLIPFSGNIDWKHILQTVYRYNPFLNLTLEVHATQQQRTMLTQKQYLVQCYNSLQTLEKYIV